MIVIARQLGLAIRRCTIWCVCLALATVVMAESSQASLVSPGLPEFKLEEATSSCAPADSAPNAPAEQSQPEHVQVHAFGTSAGSTSGTSSSPSAGSNGLTGVAMRSNDANSLADLALSGWVASELRFSLPMPLGNDLLRPPQAA